jgi:hypothetical protein
MSMNFSEFKHRLGADPASQDPEFLHARTSSPEFAREAAAADRFEQKLMRATGLPVPVNLLEELKTISQGAPAGARPWWRYALAASLLLAVATAGVVWRIDGSRMASLESDLAYHYQLDGAKLLLMAEGQSASNVEEVLNHFQAQMSPELSRMVGYIKICRTPDGETAHMVLHTEHGPVTLIFMPDRGVTGGGLVVFDGMQAQLVSLANGSAAIIATSDQDISGVYALVVNSITPLEANA